MKAFPFFAITFLFASIAGYAQDSKQGGEPDAETLKRANNPMAKTKAFNIHNYIVSSMYGTDASANQLMLRYAQPVKKFLLRATMPLVVSAPPDSGPTSGLGDFNAFAIYSFPSNTGNQLGIGPLLTIPTATNKALGQGKWQVGVAALAFFAKSHLVQGGTLLQYQVSFAGDKDRESVSLLTPQVFVIWQIGGGTYLRSSGTWSFDLNSGDYNIPLGLGIGKVFKVGGVVFNIFAEPQFSVLASGSGQTKFQTFVGFNTQF